VAGIKVCMPQSLCERTMHRRRVLAGCEVSRIGGILSRALAQGKGKLVHAHSTRARFEQYIMPHLAAAYNLARWLTRHDQDAEDVVQEAFLRAYKFFGNFHGGDSRAWLLTIVRHTCYTWLRQNRAHELTEEFDETLHDVTRADVNPETLLLHDAQQQLLQRALQALPVAFREVVVLRDLEGLSYKDIAHITDLPLGTVMSRLARARTRLQQYVTAHLHTEAERGL
jgi:RNA polymerase sigma factor (sigma-70 family)